MPRVLKPSRSPTTNNPTANEKKQTESLCYPNVTASKCKQTQQVKSFRRGFYGSFIGDSHTHPLPGAGVDLREWALAEVSLEAAPPPTVGWRQCADSNTDAHGRSADRARRRRSGQSHAGTSSGRRAQISSSGLAQVSASTLPTAGFTASTARIVAAQSQ